MGPPASLRDLYADTSSAWSFVPITSKPDMPELAPPPIWATRQTNSSVFDLSPHDFESSWPSSGNIQEIASMLATVVFSQYAMSVVAMPWEVGKLLLQVQWVPRKDGGSQPRESADSEEEEGEVRSSSLSDGSNDDDDDSYFTDPNALRPLQRQRLQAEETADEEAALPDYVMPVGEADGVWGMIKQLSGFRGEGWLSLWKGLLTTAIMETITSGLQPAVSTALQSVFLPFVAQPIVLPVASHLITGIVISPLELVRTRLVIQSAAQPTYSGPIDALTQIVRDEGGWRSLYFHPQLLLPTLLDCTLRPLVGLALPDLLMHHLGLHIAREVNPLAWNCLQLAASCLGLLATLPFETVRRRLQAQTRGNASPIPMCVQLRPVRYNGVVDAFWHILTEERSDTPPHRRKCRKRRTSHGSVDEVPIVPERGNESWLRTTGIGQLYRGLGMRLGACALAFVLALFEPTNDNGWTEL
ncbi:mitochondrial carrier [Fistulina hepatica ATCC 64428]|uniref:Mitochondrial carrier n=1 Tax=Fistulina hepatica ATCC 64428 TaxID=1128425 RepID=A0A0D7ABW9_9AGAR|nr:mitochondrial carrier [Fistulina hepatica ATCC 64428]